MGMVDNLDFSWHNYDGSHNALRILVVYPDQYDPGASRDIRLLPSLPHASDEAMQVVNLLGAKVLTGHRATILGLLDILPSGWDILWLVTHCDDHGWYLRDGPVPVSEMVPLVQTAGVWLTVMNTCASLPIAQRVANELGTTVIATITSVPDRQAMVTGTLFAQRLAAGLDYVTAFHQAQPGGPDSPYKLVEAKMGISMNPDRRQYGRDTPDTATLAKFIRSVEDLNLIINGSEHLGVPPLKNLRKEVDIRLDEISVQLSLIQAHLVKIEGRQRIRNIAMWSMATGLLLLAAIVILIVSRQGII